MFSNNAERRRYLRLDSRIPMRYRKIETNIQEFKGSLMRNISEGGASMTIYEFLPLNLRLALEIPLMFGKKPLQGISRVAWVAKAAFGEQYDVGLEFVNLNHENLTQVAKFVFDKSIEKVL